MYKHSSIAHLYLFGHSYWYKEFPIQSEKNLLEQCMGLQFELVCQVKYWELCHFGLKHNKEIEQLVKILKEAIQISLSV